MIISLLVRETLRLYVAFICEFVHNFLFPYILSELKMIILRTDNIWRVNVVE